MRWHASVTLSGVVRRRSSKGSPNEDGSGTSVNRSFVRQTQIPRSRLRQENRAKSMVRVTYVSAGHRRLVGTRGTFARRS
jgi:hypothetical protein